MKPYKKSFKAKTTMYRKEYKVETQELRNWDWDECIARYPRYNRGTKKSGFLYHIHYPRLMSYQIRMYKTWKHNRKTQWKE